MQYCRFMQRESCFLKFRASQIAAASLVFSFNLSASPIIESVLNVKQIPEEKLQKRMKETLTLHKDIVGVKAETDDKLKAKSPLFWWNNSIQ